MDLALQVLGPILDDDPAPGRARVADAGSLTVLAADREYPIRASLRPLYDPMSERVRTGS